MYLINVCWGRVLTQLSSAAFSLFTPLQQPYAPVSTVDSLKATRPLLLLELFKEYF